jgi:hypothetical protein
MHRIARAKVISLICLLLFSAVGAARGELLFQGTTYTLRWRQSETNDNVPQTAGNPHCFQMGSTLSVRVVNPPPGMTHWYVTSAMLKSKVTNAVYWNVNSGQWLPIGSAFTLPNIPNHIDHCDLMVTWAYLYNGVLIIPQGTITTESFLVLGAPKTPMNPAWVSVLRHTCVWASMETTAVGAVGKLTDELYVRGHYNDGSHAYTSNETNAGETFHLKSFLEDTQFPWGQCNDFADFLCCLVTSVGAYDLKAQRTYPFDTAAFHYKLLIPAGHTMPRSGNWEYHQFTLHSSPLVWDGCISLVGNGVPKGWTRDGDYKDRLVDFFLFGIWQPTPAAGFVPAVTTLPVPP